MQRSGLLPEGKAGATGCAELALLLFFRVRGLKWL